MSESTAAHIDPETAQKVSSAYHSMLDIIGEVEPRVAQATRQELDDQRHSLKLIASENYASLPVLATMGTWFSDKYAEGTIGHRFYAGCQNVDTVESLAAEHARTIDALVVVDHRGDDREPPVGRAVRGHPGIK